MLKKEREAIEKIGFPTKCTNRRFVEYLKAFLSIDVIKLSVM